VREHLLEMRRIDLDAQGARLELERDLDVLSHEALEHRRQVRDRLAHIEHPRPQHLLAAEGQELLCEPGGALAGGDDLLQL
jgi:hypothetical protein